VTESLGDDDSIYNLAFDTKSRTLLIQLLGREDETFELTDQDGYTNYVANYNDWDHETPGIAHRRDMNPQFLNR
jgi:histone deacetylase complex regulatory component SIN3